VPLCEHSKDHMLLVCVTGPWHDCAEWICISSTTSCGCSACGTLFFCTRLAPPSWPKLLACRPWLGLVQALLSASPSAMATSPQRSITRWADCRLCELLCAGPGPVSRPWTGAESAQVDMTRCVEPGQFRNSYSNSRIAAGTVATLLLACSPSNACTDA